MLSKIKYKTDVNSHLWDANEEATEIISRSSLRDARDAMKALEMHAATTWRDSVRSTLVKYAQEDRGKVDSVTQALKQLANATFNTEDEKNLEAMKDDPVLLVSYLNLPKPEEAATCGSGAATAAAGLGPTGGAGGSSGPAVPARELLKAPYRSALTVFKKTPTSHKRPYPTLCHLVPWPMDEAMVHIINTLLDKVLSDVLLTAQRAEDLRGILRDLEQQHLGTDDPVNSRHALNQRFGTAVGNIVIAVLDACVAQNKAQGRFSFSVAPNASDPSSQPDFTVTQDGLITPSGGEGQLPTVMCWTNSVILPFEDNSIAIEDAVQQACSYCVDKEWRFSFLTYFNATFFIWRLDEHTYAVTDAFLHDAPRAGLYTREMLFFIFWMALQAPWGSALPDALKERAAMYSQQPTLTLPRQEASASASRDAQGAPSSQPQQGKRLKQRPTMGSADQVSDQQSDVGALEGAPSYPLGALELTSTCLGEGQCGRVLEGRLMGCAVAVKATDTAKSPAIVEQLWHEAQIYGHLTELQGRCVPVLRGFGFWRSGGSFFLATSVVPGVPLSQCADALGLAIQQAAEQALRAIHDCGVGHGDVRAENVLVEWQGKEPKVSIIDLGHAYLDPTPEQCDNELAAMAQVFDEVAREAAMQG